MNHGSNAGRGKRVLLSLLSTTCLVVGSPVALASASNAGGAQKPVGATFGDCKNDNAGKHKGYVCPSDNGGVDSTDTGGDTGGDGGVLAY
jgi:hypothetical protein